MSTLPQPTRSSDLPLWQYVAAIGIPSIPFIIVFIRWTSLPTATVSFADSVEMVNAFLSAAAFAAVVLTLLLQRKDLYEQSCQFHEAMQMQALGTYLSVVECRRQMVSSRPVLHDDVDVKTLHLAVSLFQIGNYLERIDVALQNSTTLSADPHQAVLQQRVAELRHVIARIATLDAAIGQLEEPAATPSAKGLLEWLAFTAGDRELPQATREEVLRRCDAIAGTLSAMLDRQRHSDTRSLLAALEDDLHQLRTLLVQTVRYGTISPQVGEAVPAHAATE